MVRSERLPFVALRIFGLYVFLFSIFLVTISPCDINILVKQNMPNERFDQISPKWLLMPITINYP